MDIKEPVILIDENNIPLGYKTEEYWTDIAVFQPNTEYIEGRSKWLFDYGNRSVNVALDDIQIEFPVMVFAFKKGEDINTAIPVDITEVKNKEEICNLGLKKGVYEMVIANRKEAVKFEQEVK